MGQAAEALPRVSQQGVHSWHRLQEELDLPIVWGGSLEWFASDSRQARLAQ